jgi:Uma2 family endonuclease
MSEPKRKKPATYEDIEELPLGWVGELLEDELYAHPRPAWEHMEVAKKLSAHLVTRFEKGGGSLGGWWIGVEPELHFGQDVLVPDLAGWRRERLLQPLNRGRHFTTLAPDWVCEVLSPSTARVDRDRKMPIYFRQGVSQAWLIDPRKCTLEVYQRGRAGWRLATVYKGNVTVRAEPYDAVPLELGQLWYPGSGEVSGADEGMGEGGR